MDKGQHISSYRQKAAELRAAAEKTNNYVLRDELLETADLFDRLAKAADKIIPG